MFYIYSYINKENRNRVVCAKLIDDNNTSVVNKNVVLFESKGPKPEATFTRYFFSKSRNNEFALMFCKYPDREKKAKLNTKEYGFCVFDKNLNVKLSKVIEMPYKELEMNLEAYTVDSKGNAYMIIKSYKDDGFGKSSPFYELVKISNNGVLFKKDLNIGNVFLNNIILTDDLNGNIVITGYYSSERNRISGIFIYKFGVDGDVTAVGAGVKFYEFTEELFKSYESEKNQENIEYRGKLDAKLYFDDIFFHPNGDLVIVTEQYKSEVVNNIVKHYFFDIITLKVDKDGKLVWMKKIPKNQIGAGRSELSYKYHYNNGNDYFLFVDNDNNLNIQPNQTPKAHRNRFGGVLVAVKIDFRGFTQKSSIFDLKTEDVVVSPISFFKVNDDVLIGKCLKDRKNAVIELNFK